MTEETDHVRNEAKDQLLAAAQHRAHQGQDPELTELLSDSLVEQIFDIAWERQFDSDRTAAQRQLRSAIETAVAEVVEQHAD